MAPLCLIFQRWVLSTSGTKLLGVYLNCQLQFTVQKFLNKFEKYYIFNMVCCMCVCFMNSIRDLYKILFRKICMHIYKCMYIIKIILYVHYILDAFICIDNCLFLLKIMSH